MAAKDRISGDIPQYAVQATISDGQNLMCDIFKPVRHIPNMEYATTQKHTRRFRFPDSVWWKARIVPDHVSQHEIDRWPDNVSEYGTTAETIIPRMVERIVKRFDPLSVWLFGSMARGNCNEHSDVDLMVIMPEGTNCMDAELEITLEVNGSMLPKDIFVNTPDQWDGKVHDVGSVQYSISRHGVLLYG